MAVVKVIKGDTRIESDEELAFSEDPDVVAGAAREGCGWCPVGEFERVGPGAEVITVRTMNDREDSRHRDHYAFGEASANLVVAKICVVKVRTEGSKKKPLEGKHAAKWVADLAVQDPTALDLLARRQIHRTRLKDPAELYPENRVAFGHPPEPDIEEVSRDDGGSKSEPPEG